MTFANTNLNKDEPKEVDNKSLGGAIADKPNDGKDSDEATGSSDFDSRDKVDEDEGDELVETEEELDEFGNDPEEGVDDVDNDSFDDIDER